MIDLASTLSSAQPRAGRKSPASNRRFAFGKTGAVGDCSCHGHEPVFETDVSCPIGAQS